MKITLFVTVALSAVVGMALADDMFNNWNNNNNNWNNNWNDNDDGRFGGVIGGISGGMGSIGGGYSSIGYGSGYGSGHGLGYGSGYGAGYGYGGVKAQYVPVPATGNVGSGIGSILPLFALLFILPLIFQTSSSRDQIVLLNTTLEG